MIRQAILLALLGFLVLTSSGVAQVTLHPNDDVPKIVSSKPPGTTFIFTPGTYRLSQPIVPKDNDKFVGETACAPLENSCTAILSGGAEIGSLATASGGNYAVAKQTQQNPRGNPKVCDPGWSGCQYPEDLFFDGVPLKHLDSPTMPTIGLGEWWFDYPNHMIYFHDDPSGHKIETSVVNTAFSGPANGITVQYLTVQEFADMYPVGGVGMWHGPDESKQGTNWDIENCDIRLNHGFGVRIGLHIHILNNHIHHNGQLGIGGGLATTDIPALASVNSGIFIQGNTIDHNNYAHFNPAFGAGGFKIGAASGIIFRNNVVRDNDGQGVHFDVDSANELVDGNTIIDNPDGDGLTQELGNGTSIFRNNVVLRNGVHINSSGYYNQIGVHASSGVEVYCNVMEVPPSNGGVGAWTVVAAPRGSSQFPPFQYRSAFGNYVHHNTIIFDAGSKGTAGFGQHDPEHQPDFFAKNPPPDYNSYHLPNRSEGRFLYDSTNRLSNFSDHQRSRAEAHGSVDSNYTSGFPRVAITSPNDGASVTNPATISATASDSSGIRKVEFYVDWKLEGTLTTSPYDFTWNNGAPGRHVVAAMAYSNAGIGSCYAVTLNQQ